MGRWMCIGRGFQGSWWFGVQCPPSLLMSCAEKRRFSRDVGEEGRLPTAGSFLYDPVAPNDIFYCRIDVCKVFLFLSLIDYIDQNSSCVIIRVAVNVYYHKSGYAEARPPRGFKPLHVDVGMTAGTASTSNNRQFTVDGYDRRVVPVSPIYWGGY